MDNSRATVTAVNSAAHPHSPTAGIQEAIDALPERGGVLLIPAGTYVVRRSIVLRAGVTLRGEGAASVLTRPPPVVFELTAPSPANRIEAELSTVEGLRPGDEIWINEPTQGGWYSRHLEIRAIHGHRVEGVLVEGSPERSYHPEGGAWGANFYPMVLIPRCSDAAIEDLTVDGGSHAYDAGRVADFTCTAIHGVKALNLRVSRVTVRRWPADGISAQGGTATVSGCLVEECLGNGYHPGSDIRQSFWTHNVSRRNGWNGFYFCLGVRNAVVANNVFSDNRHNGIGGLSDPDAYNIITGNVIARNGRRGIDAPQSLGNIISNNLVQDNSQAVPGAFPGIGMQHHRGNVVTGNRCTDSQDHPTQLTGIEMTDAQGENVVADNLAPVYAGACALPIPRGELRPAAARPKMTGRMDDPIWKDADLLSIDRMAEDGKPAAVAAQAAFLHDRRFLYIGVRCAEPLVGRLRDRFRARGDDVWMENSFEIFIAPGHPSEGCYQFVVNSLGTVYELQYAGTRSIGWASGGEAFAHRGSDFWSVEMAIPLAAFGFEALKAGTELKANVYRSRLTVFPNEATAWSPTFGGPTNLSRRFGTLVVR